MLTKKRPMTGSVMPHLMAAWAAAVADLVAAMVDHRILDLHFPTCSTICSAISWAVAVVAAVVADSVPLEVRIYGIICAFHWTKRSMDCKKPSISQDHPHAIRALAQVLLAALNRRPARHALAWVKYALNKGFSPLSAHAQPVPEWVKRSKTHADLAVVQVGSKKNARFR